VSKGSRTGITPLRALKFNNPDAFQAHRCAELRACTNSRRAG